jgi:hypothetical protein
MHEALKKGDDFFYSNLFYQVSALTLEKTFDKASRDIIKGGMGPDPNGKNDRTSCFK